MGIDTALILGVIQGLTEFIPVSSSGHLILAREFFGFTTPEPLAVDAVLQLATALAIGAYFWRDFYNFAKAAWSTVTKKDKQAESIEDGVSRSYLWALIIGTIPAVILGLLLEDYMETVFRDPRLVIATLVIGALLMLVGEYMAKRYKDEKPVTGRRGLWVGLFQSLALAPGMSRSGSTIAGGLFVGLSRKTATRFAFMLGFPVLFGSGVKKLLDLGQTGVLMEISVPLFIGSVVAFGTGLLAIHFLIRYLEDNSLNVFVAYRIFLALIVITAFAI